MAQEMKKRSRSSNYTTENCLQLIEIVIKYIDIVENKKTDAVMWQEKNQAWNKIASEYNSGNTESRTASQLRLKYESLKKEARKEVIKERQNMLKTGGGPMVPSRHSSILNKICEIIKISAHGLSSRGDGDDIAEMDVEDVDHPLEIHFEADEVSSNSGYSDKYSIAVEETLQDRLAAEEEIDIPSEKRSETNKDWSHNNLPMLRQRKNSDLCNGIVERTESDDSQLERGSKSWVKRQIPIHNHKRPQDSLNVQEPQSRAHYRKELADLQGQLLLKQFNAKERREEEIHSLTKRKIEKELELLELKIKIKQKMLNEEQIVIDPLSK